MTHTFESLRQATIAATCAQLVDHSRVLNDLACATGKTRTEIALAQMLGVKVAVIFVPTITLAHQHRQYCEGQKVLFICGDRSVTNHPEDIVTLDIDEIARFITTPSLQQKIIFCTYQSSDKWVELYAQKPDTPVIELAIYDEAHYAAQLHDSLFACTLNEQAVRFDKRVFFTASPKKSMLESEFGALAYSYSTAQAIADGLIKDYFMVIATVSNAEVAKRITDHKLAQYAGLAIAAAKAIKECELNSLISFHSTVAGAREMAAAWNVVKGEFGLAHIEADYVDGTMSAAQIKKRLQRLAQGNYILTSCQVVGVGVDVPQVDGLIFSDPKEAHIAIQQGVGRGQRKMGPDDNAPLPIILPTIVDDEGVQGKFRALIRFLVQLRSQDVGAAPDKTSKRAISQVLSKQGGTISLLGVGDYISQEFIDAIELEVWGGSDLFDPVEFATRCQEYEDFIAAHDRFPRATPGLGGTERQLGDWAQRIRYAALAGALSEEKRAIIQQLIPDFMWGTLKDGSVAFEKRFALTGRYLRQHQTYPPATHPLTKWFKNTAAPASPLSQASVTPAQWERFKAAYPGYYESFRDTSNGLTNDAKDQFLLKVAEIKSYYSAHGVLPNVSYDGNLYIYIRRLRIELSQGKFPERKAWLIEHFPEFFTANQETFNTQGKRLHFTKTPVEAYFEHNSKMPDIYNYREMEIARKLAKQFTTTIEKDHHEL